ncbi:MAG: DNA repair protein RecN [Elusimicrobiota bacterium]
MLDTIVIKNYAIIESIEARFSAGFNVLTGETGAGKSIIVDALGLALGRRAGAGVVRKNADKCEITAVFTIKSNRAVQLFCESRGISFGDDGMLVLKRDITADGRSRGYVNSSLVILNVLENLGNLLVDIHGQNSHQTLLYPDQQRGVVDSYGKLVDEVEKVAYVYKEYTKFVEEKKLLDTSENERLQKIDLYKYQLQEISNANILEDEDLRVEQEYQRLAHAEKLAGFIKTTVETLDENEGTNVLAQMYAVKQQLESVAKIDESVRQLLVEVESLIVKIEELSSGVHDYADKVEYNPEKLEDVSDRCELIKRLKKKYGSTVPDILVYQQKITGELDKLEHSEENKAELGVKIKQAYEYLSKTAGILSDKRKSVAGKLEKQILVQLREVGLEKAKFGVSITERKDVDGNIVFDSTGKDGVVFTFAPNPGEGFKPLAEIASGGELSRLMLALKTVFAKADKIPTLIFDEIDVGIGGDMATVIGDKMALLSVSHQVITITHMPQIAACAAHHLNVDKVEKSGRTITTVRTVEGEDVVRELARMLGADEKHVSVATEAHARELAARRKNKRGN